MKIKFKNIFRRNKITDEKMWNPTLWNLAYSQSTSGENINEHTAMSYSAVFNAISLISGSIAALPLQLFKKANNIKKEVDISHKLYSLMHSSPNPYMTSMAFRETMLSHILAWGNGYAEIVRNGLNEITELWPIQPNRVSPKLKDGELFYEVRVDSKIITLKREKILHIPGLGFDGFVGYSVISLARQSIGLGKAMETFGSLYFEQGTHPGVIVYHPGKLSEQAYSNLNKSLSNAHSGLGKSHRLMLLEEGMKIDKIGIPPSDSQFIEGRQFQIPEIARWFNLPPHKLKDLTRSSFSNIEQEQISFVTDSLLPWGIRLEQNYNMQLLSEAEKKQGYYFKHIFEGLLRGSSADRANFYRIMFGIGAMSINEIRAKEDMNPIVNGDMHFVPLNMITVENAGKVLEKSPESIVKKEISDVNTQN